MFRTVPLSIIRSFSLYTQKWYMSYRFADSLRTGLGWFRPDPAPDDGQRNCPKHVEFYSKNKFEKLVHLVGFIIRIYLCVLLFYSKNKFEKLMLLLGFFIRNWTPSNALLVPLYPTAQRRLHLRPFQLFRLDVQIDRVYKPVTSYLVG